MKKYDTDSMLEIWSTGSSLSSEDPYPSSPTDVENTEDLASMGSSDLTTHTPGPDGYDINKSIHKKSTKITEAETPPEEEIPTQAPAPPPQEVPSQGDPSMMQDPSMMGGAQDPSMMGMAPPEGPTSTFDVGRVYELKKIYSRLVSMQSYLAGTTDPNLIKLRNYVSGTMDLFRTLISNIALYKDRLDEIIIVFYKVVDNVYAILSKYYKDKDSGKMVQAIEQKLFVRKRSIK